MPRLIRSYLSLAFASSVLLGCGGGSENTATDSDPSNSNQVSSEIISNDASNSSDKDTNSIPNNTGEDSGNSQDNSQALNSPTISLPENLEIWSDEPLFLKAQVSHASEVNWTLSEGENIEIVSPDSSDTQIRFNNLAKSHSLNFTLTAQNGDPTEQKKLVCILKIALKKPERQAILLYYRQNEVN